MTTLRFRSIDEMKKQYTEQAILEMVTAYLDQKAYRAEYNRRDDRVEARKAYNQRRNALLKSAMEIPELKAAAGL